MKRDWHGTKPEKKQGCPKGPPPDAVHMSSKCIVWSEGVAGAGGCRWGVFVGWGSLLWLVWVGGWVGGGPGVEMAEGGRGRPGGRAHLGVEQSSIGRFFCCWFC